MTAAFAVPPDSIVSGINGSLAQNPVPVQQMARFDNPFLHAHELFADDVALLFRLAHRFERREKLLFRVLDRDHARAERVEHAADELRFSFAHQAGIDVDAAHAVRAQRAQAQREGHGRIDAAADEEKHVAVAHRRRICSSISGTRCRGSQSFSQPQMSKTKFSRMRFPCVVWTTSG